MNENEEKEVETTQTEQSQNNVVVTPTEQVQPSVQENQTAEPTDNLSSQLSQENQNIASQQETIQQQLTEEKAREEEEKKKKEEEFLASQANKGPSGFAKFMTIVLFIFLFAFVSFFGYITEYIY